MAWLTDDAKPRVAGWGPEPQLHAPDIGSLVGSILRNKLGQQELTQKSISDAIKNMQEQRQASAFGSALQNAGIIYPGVDVSGMSSADLQRLSQQIQDQTPDTDMDAYHQAMTRLANARADDVNDPDSGTPDPAEQRRQDAEKRREVSDQIKSSQAVMKSAQLPPNAVPHALSPGETVTPGTYPFDVNGQTQNIPQGQVDQFNAARRTYDTLNQQRANIQPPGGSSAGGGASGGQYPVGTHARQGSVWYVKTATGWQPDPNFSQ